MDQFIDTAYAVTSQLFGPDSGIPWWTWVLVPVAPVITLQQLASAPLTVSGTVSPVAGRVRVFVYSGSTPTGTPITRKRVHVSQGQFTAQFPTVGPGSYTVVARSKGTAGNAPGVSAPLTVTVT